MVGDTHNLKERHNPMTMTRKHFRGVAEIVKQVPDSRVLNKSMEFPVKEGDPRVLVDTTPMKTELAGQMAGFLSAQNDRFDYRTFFEACEVEYDEAIRYVDNPYNWDENRIRPDWMV